MTCTYTLSPQFVCDGDFRMCIPQHLHSTPYTSCESHLILYRQPHNMPPYLFDLHVCMLCHKLCDVYTKIQRCIYDGSYLDTFSNTHEGYTYDLRNFYIHSSLSYDTFKKIKRGMRANTHCEVCDKAIEQL